MSLLGVTTFKFNAVPYFPKYVKIRATIGSFKLKLWNMIVELYQKVWNRCMSKFKISVLLQRFNAVLLHDCLPALDCGDWVLYLFVSFFHFFFSNISEALDNSRVDSVLVKIASSQPESAIVVAYHYHSAAVRQFRERLALYKLLKSVSKKRTYCTKKWLIMDARSAMRPCYILPMFLYIYIFFFLWPP